MKEMKRIKSDYYEKNKEKLIAYSREWRKDNPEKKKAQWKAYRENNLERIKAYRKKYYEEHKEEHKAYMKKYHEENKEELAAKQKETRSKNPEKYSARDKAYRLVLKKRALVFFGPCACCGEDRTEFISIDHINGGGTKKRQTMGEKSGTSLLKSFNKAGWPEELKKEYRILCHNCNQAIGFLGYCPHQVERDEAARTESQTEGLSGKQ